MDEFGHDVPEKWYDGDPEPHVIKGRGINIIVSAIVSALVCILVLWFKGYL